MSNPRGSLRNESDSKPVAKEDSFVRMDSAHRSNNTRRSNSGRRCNDIAQRLNTSPQADGAFDFVDSVKRPAVPPSETDVESVFKHNYPKSLLAVMSDVFKPDEELSPALLEFAGIVALWSFFVLIDGTVSFVDVQPLSNSQYQTRAPSALLYTSAMAKVFLGMAGLFTGLSALVGGSHSIAVTRTLLITECIFSLFIIVVDVFVAQGFRVHLAPLSGTTGIPQDEAQILNILGIFVLFFFTLALLLGQIVFTAALFAASATDPLRTHSMQSSWAMFWNCCFALAGLFTFVTGMIVIFSGQSSNSFNIFPNIGSLPSFTAFTGLIMLLWGVFGMCIMALGREKLIKWYGSMTIAVFVICYMNFTIVQLSLGKNGPSGAAARNTGMVFAAAFLGPYFMLKSVSIAR